MLQKTLMSDGFNISTVSCILWGLEEVIKSYYWKYAGGYLAQSSWRLVSQKLTSDCSHGCVDVKKRCISQEELRDKTERLNMFMETEEVFESLFDLLVAIKFNYWKYAGDGYLAESSWSLAAWLDSCFNTDLSQTLFRCSDIISYSEEEDVGVKDSDLLDLKPYSAEDVGGGDSDLEDSSSVVSFASDWSKDNAVNFKDGQPSYCSDIISYSEEEDVGVKDSDLLDLKSYSAEDVGGGDSDQPDWLKYYYRWKYAADGDSMKPPDLYKSDESKGVSFDFKEEPSNFCYLVGTGSLQRNKLRVPTDSPSLVKGKVHVTARAPVLFVLSSLAGSSLILVVVHLSEVHWPGGDMICVCVVERRSSGPSSI